MRTTRLPPLLLTTTALVLLGLVTPAAATAIPYCGITWGSLPKTTGGDDPPDVADVLTDVRAERHACFDRLVLDMSEPDAVDAYDVATSPPL